MAAAFFKSLLFGALLAGAIGPIALLIFRTGAGRGLAAGGLAAAGAALADFSYALLAFSAGALVLPMLEAQATVIRNASSWMLVALGLWMLLRPPAGSRSGAPVAAAGPMLPAFLLTLINPMTLVVFAGFVPQLPVSGSLAASAWLALALGMGSFGVGVAVAAAGAAVGAALPAPGWQRLIHGASALGILGFGIAGLAAG